MFAFSNSYDKIGVKCFAGLKVEVRVLNNSYCILISFALV